MDLKIYEKTRYQNIYRHKKNKNYVIMMSKPIKTSISRIENKKIITIDEALKIRDNVLIKQQKALETIHKEDFDTLWDKYIFNCKFVKKQAYNTVIKKEKIYNKHLKGKIGKTISKITQNYISMFINELDTTDKQKNHIIKEIKTFFSWCVEENILIDNPISKLAKYKVNKPEMKYWIPSELKKFLDTIEEDVNSENIYKAYIARRTKLLTLLGFSLGDRIGETRAMAFNVVNENNGTISILHSINYDRKSNDFLSNTKTYESERVIDISQKLINEIDNFKNFLICNMKYDIKDDTLIFLNHSTGKPFSDCALRKAFNYYCEKANVPKIRMYDLRHTYAATMMSDGKEAYLFSKRMGHKKISTTIDVYRHLSNKVRKEIAQSTDKYI